MSWDNFEDDYSGGEESSEITFEIDLDYVVSGVKNAHLPQFEEAVSRGIRYGLEDLMDKMDAKLYDYLNMFGLSGSKLEGGIRLRRMGDTFTLECNTPYAQFVEFGTGIVGENNPHPEPIDWDYDTANHGSKGWWYPSDASDPNPYKNVSKETGQVYAWTKGQRARPFMYLTWRWAKGQATRTIRRKIREEMKREGGR